MKQTLFILLALSLSLISYSQTFTVNHITYEVISTVNNTVKTTDYDTAGGATVNIPSTVTNSGITYTVTEIGATSFYNKQLLSISIPSGVTTIWNNAFQANQLTSVTIPNSVNSIGVGAFRNNILTSVVIPNSITTIGESVFKYNQLTSITIPSNITSIGQSAFANNELTSVTIPNSVTNIDVGAFNDNQLTSINIPSSITIINASVFANNQLTSVTIPNNITSIGNSAFQLNQLASVIIPNSVTSIANFAFYNNMLTSINIPSSITSIGDGAFGNNSLNTVVSEGTTPPSITTVGGFDTFGNRSIINLIIPIGTTGVYVTDSGALWTGFNTVTEDASLSLDSFESVAGITIISTINEIKINYPSSIVLQEYVIYNLAGERIFKGSEKTISKDFLTTGVYILNASFNKGTISKKFLVR